MNYSHPPVPPSDDDAAPLSAFEIFDGEPVFDFPLWSSSMLEAFLDDFDQSSPPSSDDNESPVTSPTSSNDLLTQPSPRKLRVSLKAKRYRNRKREEMERLRDTVKTLEVRLAVLKARPTPVEAARGPFPRVWEAMATLESTSRQESERTNKEIREVMELHRQLAQKLDHVLRKVSAQSGLDGLS